MSSFHAKDGWYFTREDDGSVRIEHATSHQQFSVALDADTWASAVASVCADGEDANTFGKALILHNEPKHLARISFTHGPWTAADMFDDSDRQGSGGTEQPMNPKGTEP